MTFAPEKYDFEKIPHDKVRNLLSHDLQEKSQK